MATILVTIRQSEGGGSYEFTPADNEAIRWKVEDTNGTLFLRKAISEDGEYPPDHKFEVFRTFAHGVWADVELVD